MSQSGQTNGNETHREGTGYRIKADARLMDELGRIPDAHERAAMVDDIPPSV
jgi:hypothetical protein